MHRSLIRSLFLGFCLLSLGAFAQENRVIRVGVAEMRSPVLHEVPGDLERDRLVAALNWQKPDKQLHVKVQGVPLKGTTAEEASGKAAQKNCDYVVYTTLISTDPLPLPPGLKPNNPSSIGHEARVTVEYRLYRTGTSTAVAGALVSGEQIASVWDVIAEVMRQIASRVFADIKKVDADHKGEVDKAVGEYRKTLLADPNKELPPLPPSAEAQSHYDAAVDADHKGEVDKAVGEYRKALLADPNFAAAHYHLARILKDTGQGQAAEQEFAAACALEPKNPQVCRK